MKTTSVRILGLIGLGAALLMFVGDMCLYGHFGSGGDAISKLVITNESDTRIVVGGFIGPIAAILYCLGFLSVYFMISPRSRMLAIVVAGGAAVMLIIGGRPSSSITRALSKSVFPARSEIQACMTLPPVVPVTEPVAELACLFNVEVISVLL